MRDTPFVTAEIGINHNGDTTLAKRIVDMAKDAGCDAVKFQKRTVDAVYAKDFLDSPRESPWGKTQRAQKEGLEFGVEAYDEIDRHCKAAGIPWFASSWDVEAQKFLRRYDLAYNKVASPMLANLPLLETVAEERRHTFIATGMSTWEEIDAVVALFRRYECPFELQHCVSTYPTQPHEANLLLIPEMVRRYGAPVGFSSHEMGNVATLGAVALGAISIERHVTMDRAAYGSDQSSSVEPAEFKRFVAEIRDMARARGTGRRELSERELVSRRKLRG